MHRDTSQPSSSPSSSKNILTSHFSRKDHFYAANTATANKVPYTVNQANELIKDAITKHKDTKNNNNHSQYLVIKKSDGDHHVVIVPKLYQEDLTASSDTKGISSFLNKHAIYLLDYSQVLGEGGQGKVILAYNLVTSEKAAAKICNTAGSDYDRKQAQCERDNLTALGRHLGSSYLNAESVKKGRLPPEVTLMTYYPGKNLADFLYQRNSLKTHEDINYYPLRHQVNIFKKVAVVMGMIQQVSALHKLKLIHRDVKTENFICQDGENGKLDVVLIDLGEAVSSDTTTMDYASTFGYAAPENYALLANKAPYTFQSDYYSLGVCIAEVLSNENYQAALRGLRNEQIARDKPDEASTHEIYTMLNDAFLARPVTEEDMIRELPRDYDYEKLVNFLDNTIYQRIMRHAMHALLLSLTKENPKQRLIGSSLDEELVKIQSVYNRCIELSRSLHVMAKEIIYVCDVLESLGSTVNKPAIYKMFITQLNSLIHETKAKKAPGTDVDSLRPALMSKAADMCITLFGSDKERSQKKLQPVNVQVELKPKASA